MFLSLLFPARIRALVLRENLGNFIAVLLGILFALPFRNIASEDSLAVLTAGIRDVFVYGDTYSYTASLISAFLPTVLLLFLAYTVFGRHCIPAVFFFHAFLRCSAICIFIRAFGVVGALYGFVIYGLSDLIILPGLCISACLSAELSANVAKSCRGGGRTDIRKRTPELLCGLMFPFLGTVVTYIAIPLFCLVIN